jgi:hypothetical protein
MPSAINCVKDDRIVDVNERWENLFHVRRNDALNHTHGAGPVHLREGPLGDPRCRGTSPRTCDGKEKMGAASLAELVQIAAQLCGS